jgi:hypothetical protein
LKENLETIGYNGNYDETAAMVVVMIGLNYLSIRPSESFSLYVGKNTDTENKGLSYRQSTSKD